MTPKQALKILVNAIQSYALCGRLKQIEREAIKVLRNYLNEKEI